MKRSAPTVVLALGNDILGDDAVGFHAARSLRSEPWEGVDVVETGEAGLALLDHLVTLIKAKAWQHTRPA